MGFHRGSGITFPLKTMCHHPLRGYTSLLEGDFFHVAIVLRRCSRAQKGYSRKRGKDIPEKEGWRLGYSRINCFTRSSVVKSFAAVTRIMKWYSGSRYSGGSLDFSKCMFASS